MREAGLPAVDYLLKYSQSPCAGEAYSINRRVNVCAT